MATNSDLRICVIGAGPSGMSTLLQFAKTGNMPDIVCFERQLTWGGNWNYTWRTGLDENNEPCHSSMYRDLWTNAPKEANMEFPDYNFEQHFGKPVPSYPPSPAVKNFLEGRWINCSPVDLKQFIRFNTAVRYVRYEDGKFTVTVENRETTETYDEVFTHLIVCSGIFNFPYQPDIDGIDQFEGRVMHAHNFRNSKEFKGQTVLLIGNHFSGEDLALHCLKFGARNIIISYRTKPSGLKWPKGIEERPEVLRVDTEHAYFKDGSMAAIDAVIFCTGYRNHFPFLETKLRLATKETTYYHGDLYKSTLFINEADNRLFYIGSVPIFYTMLYFDTVATWVSKYILGTLPDEPKSKQEIVEDIAIWKSRAPTQTGQRACTEFQTALMDDLTKVSGYSRIVLKAYPIFQEWLNHREEGIANYRFYHQFRSIYTGSLSPLRKPFMIEYDDSIEGFVKANYQENGRTSILQNGHI